MYYYMFFLALFLQSPLLPFIIRTSATILMAKTKVYIQHIKHSTEQSIRTQTHISPIHIEVNIYRDVYIDRWLTEENHIESIYAIVSHHTRSSHQPFSFLKHKYLAISNKQAVPAASAAAGGCPNGRHCSSLL